MHLDVGGAGAGGLALRLRDVHLELDVARQDRAAAAASVLGAERRR